MLIIICLNKGKEITYFASWHLLSDNQPEMFVQSFRASSFLPSLDWLPIRVKPGEIVVVVVVVVVVDIYHDQARLAYALPSSRGSFNSCSEVTP